MGLHGLACCVSLGLAALVALPFRDPLGSGPLVGSWVGRGPVPSVVRANVSSGPPPTDDAPTGLPPALVSHAHCWGRYAGRHEMLPQPLPEAPSEAVLAQAGDLSRAIAKGIFDDSMPEAWSHYLAAVSRKIGVATAPTRKLKILIAAFVTMDALHNLAFTLRKLQASGTGDEFKLALFYYRMPLGQLPDLGYLGPVLAPHIVLQWSGTGCKHQYHWHLTPELVSSFDYIWLIDGDVMFDFFDWALFKYYMLKSNALMAQPSSLPFSRLPGERASYHGILQMAGADTKTGAIDAAWETEWAECMAVIMSSKIWEIVYLRSVSVSNTSGLFAVEGIWNAVPNLLWQEGCTDIRSLVVNLTPIRHVNCRDYSNSSSRCGLEPSITECQPLVPKEVESLRRNFPHCDRPDKPMAQWKTLYRQVCFWRKKWDRRYKSWPAPRV